MSAKSCKVVQWATGYVGKTAIRHFVSNPAYELVGVLVTNPKKVGKDAGNIAKIAPTGVIATDDPEQIIALDADCVHFAQLVQDIDMICRLLRSGKNVVTPLGPYYYHGRFSEELETIEAACRDGGTSFHGGGIHPGFAGDLLAITALRLMDRVEHIHLYDVLDHLANPSSYIEFMGFGRTPEDVLENPGRSPEAPLIFAQSMEMVAHTLGLEIDDVTSKLNLATATQDIAWSDGVVSQGTVAGQHYEWTGLSNGKPIITYHCFWKMGEENIEPNWDCGPSGFRILIEGNPPMDMTLRTIAKPGEPLRYAGLPWTAMACVNVIPTVCEAAPGIVTHFDLGVPKLHGLVRD
ncbi:MAG: hypothetical protein P8J20_06820 [Novosphingobium sp.]|nr:hypothetical protein [Novosphingobium sp.]